MSPSAAERLERATWDLFWVPEDARRIDRAELCAIGAAGRGATYNAVFRATPGADGVQALIAEVSALHAGARSRYQLADTRDSSSLVAALSDVGYEIAHRHDARAVAVDRFTPRPDSGFTVRAVVDLATLRDANAVSAAAFGNSGHDADEDRELALFTAGGRSRFFVAYDGEVPVASGGLNLFRQIGVAFLWGGGTAPSARGRGAYSALVAARVAAARAASISLVGLYARTTTSSPIVGAQGFERVGAMDHWERAPDPREPPAAKAALR